MNLKTRTAPLARCLILTILLGFATLSGCVFPGVYKLNVQQGNIVTQDMLDKLQPGMTERQVTFIMGNPVLQTPYAPLRWDYLYTLEERDTITQSYSISLFFDATRRFTHYTGTLPGKAVQEEDQLNSLPQQPTSPNTVPDDF